MTSSGTTGPCHVLYIYAQLNQTTNVFLASCDDTSAREYAMIREGIVHIMTSMRFSVYVCS